MTINVDDVVDVFKLHTDVYNSGYFAHLKGYLIKHLKKGELIFEEGVVIILTQYQRQTVLGDYAAVKGDYNIREIVNKNPGNNNSISILNKVFENLEKPTKIWLTIKQDNKRGINFYKKAGFIITGSKTRNCGTLDCYMMCKNLEKN
jgi:hypothetical protein